MSGCVVFLLGNDPTGQTRGSQEDMSGEPPGQLTVPQRSVAVCELAGSRALRRVVLKERAAVEAVGATVGATVGAELRAVVEAVGAAVGAELLLEAEATPVAAAGGTLVVGVAFQRAGGLGPKGGLAG